MDTTADQRIILEATAGRSATSAIGGAAAVVLSILGLAGIFPDLLMPIAVIAIGAMFLFKGGTLAAEYSHALSSLQGTGGERTELGGGLSAELVAGAAGVVLGILALLGVATPTLPAIAAIVFGAALAMSGAATHELNVLRIRSSGASETAQHLASQAVSASIGAEVLVGLGSVVLGILALIGMSPTVLLLAALLSIGGASLLTGASVGGRLATMFAH